MRTSAFDRLPRTNRSHAENRFLVDIICSKRLCRIPSPVTTPPQGISKAERELFDVPVVHILTDLYLFWTEVQSRFPKTKRYSLGNRCDKILLQVLENTLRAAHGSGPQKISCLEEAGGNLDVAKVLFRVAKDAKCIKHDEYLTIQSKLQEVGKMIGGWLKNSRNRNAAHPAAFRNS